MEGLRIRTLSLGLIAAAAFSVVASLALSQGAHAQIPGAVEGLQITPSLVELNVEPGKSYRVELGVTNVTTSNLVFTSATNDFAAKDETGTPNVILDDAPRTSSIKSWVTPIATFNLQPNEQRTLNATVNVPADAEPGGHYGVIRFSGGVPSVNGGEVGITASAGTLLLVRVAGDVKEDLSLLTFSPAKDGKLGSFFENGPLQFVTRFENKGSVHVRPVGQVEVRDSFGNVVETVQVNPEQGNVLPSSIRRFESTLNQDWLFGRYTADISVAYGTTGQAITQTIAFWIIPWKLILIALLVLVTLFFILRTSIRRYNRFIIGQAKGSTRSKATATKAKSNAGAKTKKTAPVKKSKK